MNFIVADADGTVHDADDDLAAIRARLAGTAREAIADAAPIAERRGIVDWDVGDAAAGRRVDRRRSSSRVATRRCSTTTTACRCAC